MYTSVVLVVPDILEVNEMNRYSLSVIILPIMLLCARVTFNPAAVYALWFVHGSENSTGFQAIQPERLVGPMLGSIIGGSFCSHFFPDDPACWKRKANS